METILSQTEAENILEQLSEQEKIEIERDKIRFGEFFICENNEHYYRINPIDVIIVNGKPVLIRSVSSTMI